MPEYMYLLSKTIYNKYNKKTVKVPIKYNVKNPAKASGVSINGKFSKKQYYALAKKVIKFINTNKQVPNFVASNKGNLQYQTALYALNKVVYYSKINKGALPASLNVNIAKSHNMNKVMPNMVRSSSKTGTTAIVPTSPATGGISLVAIKDASSRVNAFVKQNNILPNYVEINGKQYTMQKFLYLVSTAIVNINKKSTANIAEVDVSSPPQPSGVSINGALSKANYVDLASRVSNYIIKNKQAPNFASSPLGSIQYQTLISEFSKILEYEKIYKTLPNSVTINVKPTDPINKAIPGTGNTGNTGNSSASLNDKYNGEDLSNFLKPTKNCQVTDPIIKTLVAGITKNCNNNKEKATAIFNWMIANVGYSFYYNTVKGAIGTYNAKSGNCVDQSHLSIALYRAAGIPARYVHGTCTFSSGSVYGHVWVQVLIDGVWTVSDTTSKNNKLGVVNNWNPNTYTLNGKFSEILF